MPITQKHVPNTREHSLSKEQEKERVQGEGGTLIHALEKRIREREREKEKIT